MFDTERVVGVQKTTGSFYDRWFTRRVSRYVTAAALKAGVVNPNIVTTANTLLGMSAWVLVALDSRILVAVSLIHLYAVLDSVDGELARATGRTSTEGMFLEDYSAYLMINGHWLAMGSYLTSVLGSWWPLGLSVAMVGFGRCAMPAARRAILKAMKQQQGTTVMINPLKSPAEANSRFIRFVFQDSLHPSTMWAVTTTVLLIEKGFGGSHLALLIVFVGYLCLAATREFVIVVRLLSGGGLRLLNSRPELDQSEPRSSQRRR